MGSNNWKSGGSVYEVDEIIPHENYNETNYSNDICLIQINGKIKFNPKVQPIKYSKKFVKAGTELETFGWGRLIGVSTFVACYVLRYDNNRVNFILYEFRKMVRFQIICKC